MENNQIQSEHKSRYLKRFSDYDKLFTSGVLLILFEIVMMINFIYYIGTMLFNPNSLTTINITFSILGAVLVLTIIIGTYQSTTDYMRKVDTIINKNLQKDLAETLHKKSENLFSICVTCSLIIFTISVTISYFLNIEIIFVQVIYFVLIVLIANKLKKYNIYSKYLVSKLIYNLEQKERA